MNVKNCRNCGKLFNYIGGLNICPQCKEDAEKKFIKLRKRYSEQKNLVVRYLTTADFAFEKVLEIDIPDE